MALKTTQNQLKKQYQAVIAELKMAIRLKCSDCLGYFVDPYEACADENCPLLKFYPTKNQAKHSPKFKQEMIGLAKARGNDQSFVAEIGKDEPSNGPATTPEGVVEGGWHIA